MKRTLSVLAILVGLLVLPTMVLGVCGTRPDCPDCVAVETCEAELLCAWELCDQATEELCEAAGCTWNIDTCEAPYCYDQEVMTIGPSGINSLLANVGGLFSDASLFIWVVIGLPLGFVIIRRVIGLLPKK